MMPPLSICSYLLLLVGVLIATSTLSAEAPLRELSIYQLEQRREAIKNELTHLASISLRSGVGAVGYQSNHRKEPANTEWIQIDLGEELPIDQVVLVPTIERDSKTGLKADGFPVEFRILAGTADTSNVVASFTAEDELLPRIAPVTVPISPLTASWVRIECTRLSPRSWTNTQHTLMLSEIMIFNGKMNVALQKPVQTSSSIHSSAARHERFLVDGFVPYIMDAAHGERSPARSLIFKPEANRRTLTIDLGASFPVDQINLHAVDLSHSIPEAATDGYAIPQRLRITGSNHPDFAEQTLLFEYERESIYDAGPIIMRSFPETRCRYVWITALEDQTNTDLEDRSLRIGFAEIEILSNGKNKALGQPVTAGSDIHSSQIALQRMTDGLNFYGEILSTWDWMNQLARRHELENTLPLLQHQLNLKHARQQIITKRLAWLTALLAAGIGITILTHRRLRMRQATRMKERFAADLHDELGANLHAIGFLGTHIKDILDSPEQLLRTVDEIKSLTERTSEATRYCIDSQTAKEIHTDLAADLKRTARRIIANLEYTLNIEGEEILNALKPRTRSDLFLFFKESLVNINRHADASVVRIKLAASTQQIHISISDNGRGLSNDENQTVPASLQRRAKLLGAQVSVEPAESGGTCISLKLKNGRTRLFN